MKTLLNESPAILWLTDPDGRRCFVNHRWGTQTGQPAHRAEGFGWLDCVHAEDRQQVRDAFQLANEQRTPFSIKYRLKMHAGNYRWTIDAGNPRFDDQGNFLGYAGTMVDVQELQQIGLKEDQRFRAFAEAMPQMAFIADPSGAIIYFNQRHYDYFGLERHTVEGWRWTQQNLHHPDEIEHVVASWRKTIQNGEPYQIEYRLRRWDGQYRWHLGRAVPLKDEHGQITEWLGTNTDIHEQKIAAEEAARAKQAAEQANMMKTRFLANMSHEIRSPMSTVLGYADLLCDHNLSSQERTRYAELIKTSGSHLLAVIDDILDLTKVEAGQLIVEPAPTNILRLVSKCIETMTVVARKKNIPVRLSVCTPIPDDFSTDALRFRQILTNLLSNAIKFTEQGQIEVKLSYSDPERMLEITVEDTGIGMEASIQESLFRPFSQGDSSITRRYGGTGLGLYLSRQLATTLAGDLQLAWSAPGMGSCFVLSLPCSDAAAAKPGPNSSDLAPAVGVIKEEGLYAGLKILLVEDSEEIRALLKIYLDVLGVKTDTAENGEEAVHKASQCTYDLIFMDVMMPVMNGLEATRRLRQMGYTAPIVALTAHALGNEVEETIEAGCNDHLSKPVSRQDICTAISRACLANPGASLTSGRTHDPRPPR